MYETGRIGWDKQRLPGHIQWPYAWHLTQEDFHARQKAHTPVLDVESVCTAVPSLLPPDVHAILLTSTSQPSPLGRKSRMQVYNAGSRPEVWFAAAGESGNGNVVGSEMKSKLSVIV